MNLLNIASFTVISESQTKEILSVSNFSDFKSSRISTAKSKQQPFKFKSESTISLHSNCHRTWEALKDPVAIVTNLYKNETIMSEYLKGPFLTRTRLKEINTYF